MIARLRQGLLGIVLLAAGFSALECSVEDKLDAHLWRCDPEAKGDQCGTTDGKPMTCWRGYCMPSCDPAHPPPAGSSVECLDAGVLLEKCDPMNEDCGPDLSCYRTDLFFNRGLCVPFSVCEKSAECPDPGHPACTKEVLEKRIGPRSTVLFLDHLLCVAEGCADGAYNCPTGERCLGRSYAIANNDLPDVCVPLCDGKGRCPPNFSCARSAAALGADALCLPGFPGIRCQSEQDCVVGSCVPTGAGFSVCTITCQDDHGCEFLNAPPTYFRCAGPTPDGEKHCLNTAPFQGLECTSDADCGSEAPICSHYSPYLETPQYLECRTACDADGRCPARGGLAHVCLEDGTCYPGLFSMPCNDSSECLSPFACHTVTPDGREYIQSPKICTIECTSDDDCQGDSNSLSLAEQVLGYCDGHFCRVGALPGKPCDDGTQCLSASCVGHVCQCSKDICPGCNADSCPP